MTFIGGSSHLKSNMSNKGTHSLWSPCLCSSRTEKETLEQTVWRSQWKHCIGNTQTLACSKSTQIPNNVHTQLVWFRKTTCSQIFLGTHTHTAASPITNYRSCDLTRPGQWFSKKWTKRNLSWNLSSQLLHAELGRQCCRWEVEQGTMEPWGIAWNGCKPKHRH